MDLLIGVWGICTSLNTGVLPDGSLGGLRSPPICRCFPAPLQQGCVAHHSFLLMQKQVQHPQKGHKVFAHPSRLLCL